MSDKKNKKTDTVVYDNDLNKIALKNFKPNELDLLFAILTKMRNKGLTELELKLSDLRLLSRYDLKSSFSNFKKDIMSTYDKLLQLNLTLIEGKKTIKFVLFNKYELDEEIESILISLNPEFSYIVNALTCNFTKFELNEMTSLRSKYSKNLYRLLKQYKYTGWAEFSIEFFREMMDIPDSYRMADINKRVLNIAIKELKPMFSNLKIEKIKGKTRKDSKRVVRIKFTFDREFDDTDEQGCLTFQENGEYYQQHIYDLNEKEVRKKYGK